MRFDNRKMRHIRHGHQSNINEIDRRASSKDIRQAPVETYTRVSNQIKIMSYAKLEFPRVFKDSRQTRRVAKTCRSVGVSSTLAINLNNKWVPTASKKFPTQQKRRCWGFKRWIYEELPLMKLYEKKKTKRYARFLTRLFCKSLKRRIILHAFLFYLNLWNFPKFVMGILLIGWYTSLFSNPSLSEYQLFSLFSPSNRCHGNREPRSVRILSIL